MFFAPAASSISTAVAAIAGMIPDMAATAVEMLEAAGAKNIQPFQVPDRVPGYGIHELGTARMGANPKTSVLNPFCQSHDVKNLFVTDASCFVSGGCQNPTLTIMALTVRACDYLMQEMKAGNVGSDVGPTCS